MESLTSKLQAMNVNQLMAINRAVCDVIRSKRAEDTFEKARQFRVGQTVQFRSKQGQMIQIRIDRINTKSVSGKEIGSFRTWRVHPTFLTAV